MTTHDLYVAETPRETWDVPAAGDARFTWEYDDGRARLLALYQKGKDKQWDATDADRLVAEVDPGEPARPRRGVLPDLRLADLPEAEPAGQGRDVPAPRRLAVQPVPARRAGRDDLLGAHRRVVPDLDAKFYAPPRPWTRPATSRPTRASCRTRSAASTRSTRNLQAAARLHPARLPLGHALPRHAGAHRGPRAGRLRDAARHHDQRRCPSRSSPTSCRTRPATWPSGAWR